MRPYQRRLQAPRCLRRAWKDMHYYTANTRTVVCVRACECMLGVGYEIYICYRAPHWVREVLVDLLDLSIIQHNVDLIMHSEA